MKFASFLFQLLLCTASLAATPIDGLYSNVFGGYIYVPGNINHAYGAYTLDGANYQGGFDGGASYGYKSNPMRYEAEVTYLKANIDHFNLTGLRERKPSGYNQAIFGMANVYYDVAMMNPIVQPFIGAGIGYGWIQAKFQSTAPVLSTAFSADNSSFAYQATAGVTYNFAENYALNLGYRYLGTSNLSNFGQIFQVHMANLGATYRFDGNKYK